MTDLEQNLRFMLVEAKAQLERTLAVLDAFDESAAENIEARDNYLDNLKSVVENICFSRIHGGTHLDKRAVDRLRAANIVSNNLERLGDHAANIVGQMRYLTDPEFIRRYEYRPLFEEILGALENVEDALFGQDMSRAFKICMAEFTLDSLYKTQFDRIQNELRAGMETGNLVTTLFIFRYLERIGDTLLNIGEAAIFYILGEKFKIRQYKALRESLEHEGLEIPISDVEFQSIWGTRSGCRIGRVRKGGKVERGVVFKEGARHKILKEKENIERWQKIMPWLPAKVVALREEGGSASLLVEDLPGCTMQDVVLASDDEILKNAIFMLEETALYSWEQTLEHKPVNAGFIRQAEARLPDVFRVYPYLKRPGFSIGKASVPPLSSLLAKAKDIEATLDAPFSVFTHGDYNLNNLVYCHEEQRIHYIDLYRSKRGDFVQDASVFLVSNFRLPIFDRTARGRIEAVMREFLGFSREFAEMHGDETFEARLCLGLIRSLLTSCRFELNRGFARAMFLRGVYLLRRMAAYKGDMREFRLPDLVLSYF